MMDYDAQLKLQAYLDGELSPRDARRVDGQLARDPEAQALLAELKATRTALGGFEEAIKLPESRESYWSKIERQIQRAEASANDPAPAVPWWAPLRRYLVPAAAVALLVMVGLVVIGRSPQTPGIETALADSGAFTYHDYSAGATLVWLSYPAENDVADDDEAGIVD